MSRALPPGLFGANALTAGDCVVCGALTVTGDMIDTFADLTGDRFEIHMSTSAAQAHGFAARVAHGLLILSLIDGLKNQAAAQIKARASMGWDWTFRAPVFLGDAISARYQIANVAPAKAEDQAILTLDFTVTNQRDQIVQRGTNRLLAYR
ncbi:MAG: MaoC family dehydratase [Pseudomonadota bacterium]